MHLVSLFQQTIRLNDEAFHFNAGDAIDTKNAYKYTAQDFQNLAQAAGWHPKRLRSDHDGFFNVQDLSLAASEPHHVPQHAC
ncbi:MAG: L-histidine N(alpha)-methyltransferase [Gallionella sp.]